MPAKRTAPSTAPTLLSGGNPRIAKGEGDAPVQAYIAAMPDWKRPVGAQLDALIERAVPGVHKAVKWNSPMYAVAAVRCPGTTTGDAATAPIARVPAPCRRESATPTGSRPDSEG